MKLHQDYLRLLNQYPLRAIKNKREYQLASRILDRLAVKGEESLSAGEMDYLEALEKLITAYDDEHHLNLQMSRGAIPH